MSQPSAAVHHDQRANHDHCHELVVDGLSVSYRRVTALDGIRFSTSCGKRIALVGPNGAGKSSLLKAIAGLVARRSGTIRWRGENVRRWSREFAYLPQREEVDWSFPITVRGLVEMGRYPQTGWWRRFSRADHQAVDHALDTLGLGDLATRQIRELSGGQQQRAFLARALAQEAHVLLFDEPFTGLDRTAAATLGRLLAKLASEGRLVIASHHDLATAPVLFDDALLISTRQIAFGPVRRSLCRENLALAYHEVETPPDQPIKAPSSHA
jgi:ABC-type Mn2+/Zn2+ transport system ATPase subunit